MKKKENLEKKMEETKREKLLTQKKKSAWKYILIVVVAAALPLSWLYFREDAPQAGSPKISGTQVTEKINYQNKSISMVKTEAAAAQGGLEIPVDFVVTNKLVRFEFKGKDGAIPLMAYITPSGKVITAVSVCEPCNSTSFHIEGNQMVCNACFTRWDLETLKGISGGCLAYPPDALPHVVLNGKLTIKNADLQNWKPRVVRG